MNQYRPVREIENIFAVQVTISRHGAPSPVNLFPGQRAVLMPGDIATVQLHSYDERYQYLEGRPRQVAFIAGAGVELFVHSQFAFGALWVRITPPGNTVAVAVNEVYYVKMTADFLFEREDGAPVIRRVVAYVGRCIPEKDRLPNYVPHDYTVYGFPIAKQWRNVAPFLSAHNANYAMQYFTTKKTEPEAAAEFAVIREVLELPPQGLGCIDIRVVEVSTLREQEENGR